MAYDNLIGALINSESGGNPNATNSRSSAGGLGQFIDSTWLSTIKKYRPDVAQGKTDAQLLQLKFNPELSREMTAAYANENAQFLKARGIEPTPGAIKLSHFAGPAGAAAIYADPGKTVEALLGSKAVAANPFLRGKTGADTIAWAEGVMSPDKSMKRTIAQRYSGGKTGEENAPAAPAAPPMTGGRGSDTLTGSAGLDRLKSALSGYDADALKQSEDLITNAQKLSGAGNIASAIGGPVLAGIGGYYKDQQTAAKKADEASTIKALTDGVAVPPVIAALIRSNNPDYKAAGMDALLKLQTTTKTDGWGRPISALAAQGGSPAPSSPAPGAGPRMHVSPENPVISPEVQQPPQPIPAALQPDPGYAGQVVNRAGKQDMGAPVPAEMSAPAPVQAQQAPAPQAPAADPGYIVGPPAPKPPEGYVQKLAPDGSGFLYAADGTPIAESKVEADSRARLAEKRAANLDITKEAVGRTRDTIQNMKQSLANMPSMEDALALNRRRLEYSTPGWLGKADPTTVQQQLERIKSPEDPAWRAVAALKSAQNQLALQAMQLLPQKGSQSDKDAARVENAIGDLENATSVADLQLRFNRVHNMILQSTPGSSKEDYLPESPTIEEFQKAVNTDNWTFRAKEIESLAKKYGLRNYDVQKLAFDALRAPTKSNIFIGSQ